MENIERLKEVDGDLEVCRADRKYDEFYARVWDVRLGFEGEDGEILDESWEDTEGANRVLVIG